MKVNDVIEKVEKDLTTEELVDLIANHNRQVDLIFAEKKTDEDGYLTWDLENWTSVDGKRFIRSYGLEGRMLSDYSGYNNGGDAEGEFSQVGGFAVGEMNEGSTDPKSSKAPRIFSGRFCNALLQAVYFRVLVLEVIGIAGGVELAADGLEQRHGILHAAVFPDLILHPAVYFAELARA